MKKFTFFSLSIVTLFILVACSEEAKFDTTNGRTYVDSFEKVYNGLSEQENIEFLTYLPIVLEGKAEKLLAKHRKPISYIDAIDAYIDYQTFHEKKLEAAFQALNGLTAREVINKGVDRLKKDIESELSSSKKSLLELEEYVKYLEYLQVEQDKIEIELNTPIKVVESNNNKGLIGSYRVPVIIKNNSALTLYGFLFHEIDVFDEDDRVVRGLSHHDLNESVSKDTSKPFLEKNNKSYSSTGIAPGQIIHGTLTFNQYYWSNAQEYPATQKYYARISLGRLPLLYKGVFNVKDHPKVLKKISELKEYIQALTAELSAVSL